MPWGYRRAAGWALALLMGATALLLLAGRAPPAAGRLAAMGGFTTFQVAERTQPSSWPPWLAGGWPGKVLPDAAVVRGLSHWGGCDVEGSGPDRMARFASKLLAGEPITAEGLGGSITGGIGCRDQGRDGFLPTFYRWLNSTHGFPHPAHQLGTKARATQSSLFALCADTLIRSDADILLLDFTINDPFDVPDLNSPPRAAFEVLLRRALAKPSAPLVAVLQNYAWPRARRPGYPDPVTNPAAHGGAFWRGSDEHMVSVLVQYYGCPELSVRNAAHPLMRANASGFRVDRLRKPPHASEALAPQHTAPPDSTADFYTDGTHPTETGHRAVADLLIGFVKRAVWEEQQRQALGLQLGGEPTAAPRLPPPMLPATPDLPPGSGVCLMEDAMERLVVASKGWQYKPDRPAAGTRASQKWGWRAAAPGAWAELLLDTRPTASAGQGITPAAVLGLGLLHSYRGHGRVRVECVANCSCAAATADCFWPQQYSLAHLHRLEVTGHASCRLRLTVLNATSAPDGGTRVQLVHILFTPRGWPFPN